MTLAFLSYVCSVALFTAGVSGQNTTPTHPPIPKPTGTAPYCASSDVTIPNGDFESGSLAPWGLNHGPRSNASISLVSPGHNSNFAAQITGNWVFALTQLYIPNCEATKYKVDFDYKVVAASSSCEINVKSGRVTHPQPGFVVPSHPSDWTSASFEFSEYTADAFGILAVVDCGDADAVTLQLDNFVLTKLGSLEPQGCPRAVTVPDGDFDSASLGSWEVYTPAAIAPTQSFVSPGYDGSAYAVQLDFPTVNSAGSWSIYQNISDLCLAYEYTFSWAVDWGSYSYPPDKYDDGCYIDVQAFSCTGKPQQFYQPPAANSGWQQYSFNCRPSNSAPTIFSFDVECSAVNGAPIPPFTLKVDSFNVALSQ